MFQVEKDNKRYMKDLCTIIILTGIPLPPGCISILSCPRWIVVLLTWKCRLSIKINEVELSLEVDSQNWDPGRFHVKRQSLWDVIITVPNFFTSNESYEKETINYSRCYLVYFLDQFWKWIMISRFLAHFWKNLQLGLEYLYLMTVHSIFPLVALKPKSLNPLITE